MTIITDFTLSSGTYSNYRRTFLGTKVTLTGNITFTSNTTIYAPNANVDCSSANITITAPTSGTRTLAIISGEYLVINTINASNCDVFLMSHKTGVSNGILQVSSTNNAVTCNNFTIYMALGGSVINSSSTAVRFVANSWVINSFTGTVFSGSNHQGLTYYTNVSAGTVYDMAIYNVPTSDPTYNVNRILEARSTTNSRFSGFISGNQSEYGPLSLSAVQTEFGGTNPVGLSEYYAGGSFVPAGTKSGNVGYPTPTATSIPSSGAINFTNFYGATKV